MSMEDEVADRVMASALLDRVASGLKRGKRLRRIMTLRMEGYTISETAEEFGLSPSRIYQIENRAHRVMRIWATATFGTGYYDYPRSAPPGPTDEEIEEYAALAYPDPPPPSIQDQWSAFLGPGLVDIIAATPAYIRHRDIGPARRTTKQ